MIKCFICETVIVKYVMDLGDTVTLNVDDKDIYFCDDCSQQIAKQLIYR